MATNESEPVAASWRDRVRVQVACALIQGGPMALELSKAASAELTDKQREQSATFRFALIADRIADQVLYVIENREQRAEARESGSRSSTERTPW